MNQLDVFPRLINLRWYADILYVVFQSQIYLYYIKCSILPFLLTLLSIDSPDSLFIFLNNNVWYKNASSLHQNMNFPSFLPIESILLLSTEVFDELSYYSGNIPP